MTVRASTIAAFLGVDLRGDDVEVHSAGSWTTAGDGEVTFAKTYSPEAAERLNGRGAVFVVADPAFDGALSVPHVLTENPRLAFARVVERFFVPPLETGISPCANVSPGATIGEQVTIGPFCVVGEGVELGDAVTLRSHVTLWGRVSVGERSLIKSSTVIGEEGFGFERGDVPVRLPHLGGVRIGADVEVGALCSIARGTLDDTVIEDHVKIDDHVFIAHNVRIGRRSFVIAGAEVSGSVDIGEDAWIGPQATIRNQVRIGAGALVGMGSVVTKDVPDRMVVAGNPAAVLRERRPTDG